MTDYASLLAFRGRPPKLLCVKSYIFKLAYAFGTLAGALCLNMSTSHAGLYGDSRWCAVTNNGADAIIWACEYDTVEDCTRAERADPREIRKLAWRAVRQRGQSKTIWRDARSSSTSVLMRTEAETQAPRSGALLEP
jgi:hypothetical protein